MHPWPNPILNPLIVALKDRGSMILQMLVTTYKASQPRNYYLKSHCCENILFTFYTV
jgi:hypothetical protein